MCIILMWLDTSSLTGSHHQTSLILFSAGRFINVQTNCLMVNLQKTVYTISRKPSITCLKHGHSLSLICTFKLESSSIIRLILMVTILSCCFGRQNWLNLSLIEALWAYEGVSTSFRNHPDVKEPESLFWYVILETSLRSICAKLHLSSIIYWLSTDRNYYDTEKVWNMY